MRCYFALGALALLSHSVLALPADTQIQEISRRRLNAPQKPKGDAAVFGDKDVTTSSSGVQYIVRTVIEEIVEVIAYTVAVPVNNGHTITQVITQTVTRTNTETVTLAVSSGASTVPDTVTITISLPPIGVTSSLPATTDSIQPYTPLPSGTTAFPPPTTALSISTDLPATFTLPGNNTISTILTISTSLPATLPVYSLNETEIPTSVIESVLPVQTSLVNLTSVLTPTPIPLNTSVPSLTESIVYPFSFNLSSTTSLITLTTPPVSLNISETLVYPTSSINITLATSTPEITPTPYISTIVPPISIYTNSTVVISSTATPLTTWSVTNVLSTQIPTTMVTSVAPTATSVPEQALLCGINGTANGNYRVAIYDYQSSSQEVTLGGCYELCVGAEEATGACYSYEFYYEYGTDAPRCALYSADVYASLGEVSDVDNTWYDVGCGYPAAALTRRKFGYPRMA